MYHYELLRRVNALFDETLVPARQFTTLDELRDAVSKDIGHVPEWLQTMPRTVYLQVEEDEGDYVLDIEGSEVTP